MSEVTVFGAPRSTYVRTVRMTLDEKGVAYRLEPINPRDPGYRNSRHPFGKMTAFQHDDVKLYETSAIAHYVNDVFPGDSLVPSDPLARSLMHQWNSSVVDYIYPSMVRNYVLQYIFPSGPNGSPDREKIDKAMVENRRHLELIGETLKKSPHLAGDGLSLADLLLVPIIFILSNMPEGKEAVSAVPSVQAWQQKLTERPSFRNTMPPPPAKAS